MFTGFPWVPASGGESEALLEKPGGPVFEGVLSRDGKSVVYRLGGIPGDLYYMRRDSLGRANPLLTSAFDERALAGVGRWRHGAALGTRWTRAVLPQRRPRLRGTGAHRSGSRRGAALAPLHR